MNAWWLFLAVSIGTFIGCLIMGILGGAKITKLEVAIQSYLYGIDFNHPYIVEQAVEDMRDLVEMPKRVSR
jgi:Trk-type K+ transport system membrane component